MCSVGDLGGRRVAERLTGSIPRILMFHRFSPHPGWRSTSLASLKETLDYIQRNYRAISLDEAVSRIVQGEAAPLGPKSVVLTVDDAYEDFYQIALQEFQTRSLPVTLYVPNRFDGRSWLWPDRLLWMIRETRCLQLSLGGSSRWPVRSLQQRRFAWNSVADRLLEMNDERRKHTMRNLEEALEVRIPERPTADYQPMSWEQIRDAAKRGVCIASQAGAHIPLARESEAVQREEAARSKSRLETELGMEVRHFSYPHGRACDFSEETMRAASEAGYVSSAAAVPDVGRRITVFSLPRISSSEKVKDLQNAMSGLSHLFEWVGR